VRAVRYDVDLRPETREMTTRGDAVIVNATPAPISEVHITVARDLTGSTETETSIDGATLARDDRRLTYRIYRFATAMAPGESRHFRFTVRVRHRGFENSVEDTGLVQGGTFVNNGVVPGIGYEEDYEIWDPDARKKRGLPEKAAMPTLARDCGDRCLDSAFGSDWTSVESVVSTAPDQMAIAPGSLVREWTDKGRRYFHYRLDHDSLNFYAFVSARYEVARSEYHGIQTEVYFDKGHPWNVPKMQRAIQRSLEYYTTNFGPYFHKQARIVEFPRLRRFAQSFPSTMPYSEGVGFVANLEHPDDIDSVFYTVAHEMAHQWWGHQVAGAYVQGAQTLSETLSQYSALMVMEKEYGRDAMRKFLKYEMNGYLSGRSMERPLLRAEDQGYVYYQKGSVAMYYLKEMIGEEAVNRALRAFLEKYRYAPAPYPTAYALVDALRAETPQPLQYLIADLFENITLFSNRTLEARARKRADGKYDVTVEVLAKKVTADGKGKETEVPVNDWIDIGAFASPLPGHVFGKLIHRERVHMTQARGTYTFTVGERPETAGIDPLLLLIDRLPDDNLMKVTIGG
jgi:ABC-2 type transport system permease protein